MHIYEWCIQRHCEWHGSHHKIWCAWWLAVAFYTGGKFCTSHAHGGFSTPMNGCIFVSINKRGTCENKSKKVPSISLCKHLRLQACLHTGTCANVLASSALPAVAKCMLDRHRHCISCDCMSCPVSTTLNIPQLTVNYLFQSLLLHFGMPEVWLTERHVAIKSCVLVGTSARDENWGMLGKLFCNPPSFYSAAATFLGASFMRPGDESVSSIGISNFFKKVWQPEAQMLVAHLTTC